MTTDTQVPCQEFPSANGSCLTQVYSLYPTTSYGGGELISFLNLFKYKGPSQLQHYLKILEDLCCNCVTVHHVPLLNPASRFQPPQISIPRALPSKPPACKSKRLEVSFLENPVYDTHQAHTVPYRGPDTEAGKWHA